MKKKISLIGMILLAIFDVLLLFTGAGKNSHMYLWIGKPLNDLLAISPLSVGWSIIALVIVMRLLIFPINLHQAFRSIRFSEKQRIVQPEVHRILVWANAQEDKDVKYQGRLDSSMFPSRNGVTQASSISMWNVLLQIPALSGLYAAIANSKLIAHASFYGQSLDKPSLILGLIVVVLGFISSYLNLKQIPFELDLTSKMFMFVGPVVLFIIAMFGNGGLTLYFIVGSICSVIQSAICYKKRPGLMQETRDTFEFMHPAEEYMIEKKDAD